MGITLSLASVEVAMLAGVRVAAFLVIAPPFSHRGIPNRIKAMLAVALGLLAGPRAAEAAGPQIGTAMASGTAMFVGDLVLQVVIGLALGFLVSLTFAAVQAAGNLIDLFGGFQLAQAFDPMMQTNGAQFSRLYTMTAIVLLFASDAYQLVIAGLVRSFEALPLGTPLNLAAMAQAGTEGLTQLFLAALQVAGPLIVVLFLADVGLGLLTRVAPALNAFALGFPLKILMTLTLGVTAYTALPTIVAALTGTAVTRMLEVGQ
ncbi:flagellar biosynthetic protein FliR [Actinotalea sp. K2]|uniref:flagellar biosynthetic protein FliR n=1 Tax=Actinotalea sp. K2 TaxID=2939438 RepID=UPI002017C723|nr:flagellar biosynthetic protein FliR [Actinotalea sp. K2]MCL3860873.1 flagellar biosynthetic protein FliR [Actinotalea sp. K2]